MIRISTIIIAIAIVLVSASLGLILYSVAGISGTELAIVALTALTFLILYDAVSMRLRDRTDVGSQIADLSRGTADLARQVAEFGRRLSAMESRMASADSAGADRIQAVVGEINDLGGLVKQLAASVANHNELLSEGAPKAGVPLPAAPESEAAKAGPQPQPQLLVEKWPATAASAPADAANRGQAQILAALRSALDQNRLEVYLQPMVSLPQRKVRFYEAVTRLRDESNQILAAEAFIGIAEVGGLIGRVDHIMMLRSVQVLRRLFVRNRDVGVFCNMAAATLDSVEAFSQCLDFLEANRALAPSFVLEFKQSMFRKLRPTEAENLAALAQRGYRFSMDHVTDLRFDPRELADRGVRYIKVPACLLLDPKQASASSIHPSDLSDLLGRFGIDLIAERIEGERSVVELLDYDVRFGQGFLFAPPRPLRPEGGSSPAARSNRAESDGSGKTGGIASGDIEPPRMTGNAARARRASGTA